MPITERGRWSSTLLDERGHRIIGGLTERGLKVIGSSATFPVSDTFTRADSGSSIGTATTGQVWEVPYGTFGITSNQARSIGINNIAVLQSSNSDVTVSTNVYTSEFDVCGVTFRYSDPDNFLYAAAEDAFSTVYLRKMQGGATTELAAVTASISGSPLKVIANGSSIKVYVGTTLIITQTVTFNQTATKHGLYSVEPDSTFDNFSVDVPETGGSQTGSATLQGVGVFTANGQGSTLGSATLQGVGVFTANGQATGGSQTGSATLQGVGTFTASPLASRTGAAPLQGVGVFSATIAGLVNTRTASLQGVGTITLNGQATGSFTGAATLRGVGVLKIKNPKNLIDNFNRANGAMGTSDSGHTYTTVFGGFQISGNQAIPASGVNHAFVYTDTGMRDVAITLRVTVATSNAIYFRVVDANNWHRYSFHDAEMYLERNVGGSVTMIASGGPVITDNSTMRLFLNGDVIDMYVDNAPFFTGITETNNVNVTKQGFGYAATNSTDQNDFFSIESGGYYDNFNRTSASTLGNPSSFISWNYQGGGTWAITNNAAIDAGTSTAYVTTNVNNAMAFAEMPSPNGTLVATTISTANGIDNISVAKIVFRMIDATNWLEVCKYDGAYRIAKVDNGVFTEFIYQYAGSYPERYPTRIVIYMQGKDIIIYEDGTTGPILSFSLTADLAKYEFGTKVGMNNMFVGAPAKPALWDNFSFNYPIGAPIETFVLASDVMQGVGTISASGTRSVSNAATLRGVGTFTANGQIIAIQGASSMQGVGVFTASGQIQGSATFQGVGTFTASGSGGATSTASLRGVATFDALGNTGSGANLVAASTFTATGSIKINGGASLQGVGTLAASGVLAGTATLRGVGTFTASATARRDGGSTLQGVATLTATINGLQSGAASMFAVAMLFASGVAGLPHVDKVSLLGGRVLRVSIKGSKALTIPLQGETEFTVGLKGSKPPPVSLGGEI